MPTRTALLLGWLVLLGVAAALLLLVAAAAWWQRRREAPSRAERAEWARHAAAVAEQARQAADLAAAARARAATAEHAAAAAWRALDQAQSAHAEAVRRHRDAVRRRGEQSPDQSGQRDLGHAAFGAYRRGEISQEELLRVWRWGSGWDPELEECERALRQARAGWREAHLRYRVAAGRERFTIAEAEVAGVQERALAEEAAAAAEAAGSAR